MWTSTPWAKKTLLCCVGIDFSRQGESCLRWRQIAAAGKKTQRSRFRSLVFALPETKISPIGNFIFQPCIFRGYVSLGRVGLPVGWHSLASNLRYWCIDGGNVRLALHCVRQKIWTGANKNHEENSLWPMVCARRSLWPALIIIIITIIIIIIIIFSGY